VQTATSQDIPNRAAASFPAEPQSARSARRFVSQVLAPVADRRMIDVATLLTSELATNSVLHAGSAIDVLVTIADEEITVVVSDVHPDGPRRVQADLHSTFGRGIALVERLSDGWGVSPNLIGKGVWFSLAR
jgi:anti-sigma regulatory factor (Ser/Thr protein kinase)